MQKKRHMFPKLLCLAIGTSLVLPLQAQVTLDEIIVTAQKREENLQEVPLSISAVTGEQLELRNITSLGDLNAIAPNVTFRLNAGARLISIVSIRGSYASQPAIWIDPPVGMYLNGIYLGKAQGSVFDVVDIERIEVLRGPQGTLFGRNTEGGAINFVSRRPSGEFSGNAKVELGNYNRRIGRVQMDLPQVGIASVGFAARKERADGWASNRTGPDMGSVDSEAFRLAAKFDFSDQLRAVYEFDYSNIDQTPVPSTLLSSGGWSGTPPSYFAATYGAYFGPTMATNIGTAVQNAMLPYVTTKRPSHVFTNMTPGQKGPVEQSRGRAHALTVEFDVTEHHTLKYIGARRTMDFFDSQDIDGMPLANITLPFSLPFDLYGDGRALDQWGMEVQYYRDTEYKQTSHEFQWIASHDSVNWVAGLYSFKDEGTTLGPQSMSLFGSTTTRSDYSADTKAWAAFGQLDWHFADAWTATIGTRYTKEKREGWSHRYKTFDFNGDLKTDTGPGLLPFTSYSKTYSDTTPMAALSWAFNDDVNVYARVAKGFKSGGFSSELTDARVSTPYKPQSSLSKEIGFKSLWWDGRARVNVALFHNKVTDLQTSILQPGTTSSIMTNAGEAIYKGAEIELALQLTDDWRISGNYGYLDAKFDKYMDYSWANPGQLIDTSSNRLPPFAPENTLSLQLEGTLAHLGFGELRLLLDYSYTDSMYLYAVNKSATAPNAGGSYLKSLNTLPSTNNLNLRLQLAGVQVDGGTMDFSFFVRNLTDEDRLANSIDFGMFRNATWQDPRTYLFSVGYSW